MFRGARSRNVRILLAIYRALFEPGRGGAENKIDRSFDIAILEVLTGTLATCKNGILVTQEATVAKGHPIALDMDGNRLPPPCLPYSKRSYWRSRCRYLPPAGYRS